MPEVRPKLDQHHGWTNTEHCNCLASPYDRVQAADCWRFVINCGWIHGCLIVSLPGSPDGMFTAGALSNTAQLGQGSWILRQVQYLSPISSFGKH